MKKLKAWFVARPHVSLGISALFLSIGSTFITSVPLVAIPLILVAGAFGWIGVRLRDYSVSNHRKLKEDLEERDQRLAAAVQKLRDVNEDLRLATEDWVQAIASWASINSDARLTFYELETSRWIRRARFSPNLLYQESGRPYVPQGHGILNTSYAQGEFTIDNLSSFEDNPESYLDEQKKLGITKTIARDFVMKSRSYVCISFGRDGSRSRTFCLLFESIDANGLDLDSLRSVVHSEAKRALVRLMDLQRRVDGQIQPDSSVKLFGG